MVREVVGWRYDAQSNRCATCLIAVLASSMAVAASNLSSLDLAVSLEFTAAFNLSDSSSILSLSSSLRGICFSLPFFASSFHLFSRKE